MKLAPLGLVLVRELRASKRDDRPLAVAGAPELAAVLRRELASGGDPAALREAPAADCAALVYVLAGPPGETQERELREADRLGLPIVCLALGPVPDTVPYVLATDVVRAGPGAALPVDAVAAAVARKLGEAGTGLAARLPVMRPAVCAALVRRFALQNGGLAALAKRDSPALPALALNEVRLVLRLADAYGLRIDAGRAPELLATVGAGLGCRALARELGALFPGLRRAVDAGVAWAGTRAIGAAADRLLATREGAVRPGT